MKFGKLVLVIWSPFIIIGTMYIALYMTHYIHAKHLYSQSQSNFIACQNTATSGGNGEIGFVPNCKTAGSINHGFLGLPYFKPGDFN